MIKIILEKEFKEKILDNDNKILVDFYADWCGPCKLLHQVLEDISDNYDIFKINVDKATSLARKYGILSIPCLILFENGKEKNRLVGFHQKEEIIDFIDQN